MSKKTNKKRFDFCKIYNKKDGQSTDNPLLEESKQNSKINRLDKNKKEGEIAFYNKIKKSQEEKRNEERLLLNKLNLPKARYENLFDDEYMNYFKEEQNLNNFTKAIDEIKNNYDIKKNEGIFSDLIDTYIFICFNKTIIKIYIYLKELYEEFQNKNYNWEKQFFELYNINEAQTKICQLFSLFKEVNNNLYLEIFFESLSSKLMLFFHRIYMKRIFLNLINNEKIIPLSIINEQNYISKSLVSNIIKNIIGYKILNNNNNKIEEKEKEKEEEEEKMKYFYILLDFYLFFEETFLIKNDSFKKKIAKE